MQNSLVELWALFDFVCNGALLGSKPTFSAQFETPIANSTARDATDLQKETGQRVGFVPSWQPEVEALMRSPICS